MAEAEPIGLSINTATTRRKWSLPEAAENYARLGVSGIAPWRDQIAACGLKESARAIRDSGLTVTGLCRGGMFTAADTAGIRAARDNNLRALEEARALDAPCLVLVCGGLPKGSRDICGARRMIAEGIADLLPEARKAGVRLAIEPLHPMYAADRNLVNTLGQALDLCQQIDPNPGPDPDLGIALDVYHVWWDPQLADNIARAEKGRLHAFHICDWRVPTRDVLLDRGMMGDGAVDLEGIAKMVAKQGFSGLPEVEIFSDELWGRDPEDMVCLCLDRSLGVRKILRAP